jgi:hypothetical protein
MKKSLALVAIFQNLKLYALTLNKLEHAIFYAPAD